MEDYRDMEGKYMILRFFNNGKKTEIIKRGLTLKEARKHCSDPATEKEGEWFDGYEKEINN